MECNQCAKPALAQCSQCQNAFYCSQQCANKDYKRHIKSNCRRFFYVLNSKALSTENRAFREVVYTTKEFQFVEMYLKPGQDIGLEVHPNTTQYFYIQQGKGECNVDESDYTQSLIEGSVLIVPSGVTHNVVASKDGPGLWLHTTYSPPHHPPGTVEYK